MLDILIHDDELNEARLASLRLLLLDTSIMAPGPLDTECWIWTGGKAGDGYGGMRIWGLSEPMYAHRLSWVAFRGLIPNDLWCLHKCDVRMCINPDHLYLGTPQDNVNDREARKSKPSWRRL